MNKRQTTKLVLIDHSTGECIILGNKRVFARMFNIPEETVVNWFREDSKIIKELNGCKYTIYKPSGLITKGS